MTADGPLRRRPHGLIRRGLAVTFLEGIIGAAIFNVLEQWLVPLLQTRLGASATAVALAITAIPMLGSLIAGLGAAYIIHALGGAKRTVVMGAGVQTACMLLCIPAMLAPAAWWSAPAVLALGSLTCLLNGICGAAWLTWMGELVPRRIQGRYFGRRGRSFYLTRMLVAALILGVVAWWPITALAATPGDGLGPVLILVIGALARGGGTLLFALTPVPPGLARHDQAPGEPLRQVSSDLRDFLRSAPRTVFGRWILLWAAMQFGITLPGQFITYFMSQPVAAGGLGLHADPAFYTLLLQIGILVRLVLFPFIGRWVDRHGGAAVLRVSLVGMTLATGSWAFTAHPGLLLVNEVLFQVFAAAAECATLVLLLSCSTGVGERARLVGYQQTLMYAAQLVASLLGTTLLAVLPAYDGSVFRTLFLVGLGLRLPVVVVAWRMLR